VVQKKYYWRIDSFVVNSNFFDHPVITLVLKISENYHSHTTLLHNNFALSTWVRFRNTSYGCTVYLYRFVGINNNPLKVEQQIVRQNRRKSSLKECFFVILALKIQCNIVKNTLLQPGHHIIVNK